MVRGVKNEIYYYRNDGRGYRGQKRKSDYAS